MYLNGDALEWQNGLSDRVCHEINQSLEVWEDELLREYRRISQHAEFRIESTAR